MLSREVVWKCVPEAGGGGGRGEGGGCGANTCFGEGRCNQIEVCPGSI